MSAAPIVDLQQLAAQRRVVLKDEPDTSVELLGVEPAAVVQKTYRNRGLRLAQTLWRRSRAEREFHNLGAIAQRGLPCTPPRQWSEVRRLGLVRSSTLVTDYIGAARSLKSVLADSSPVGRSAARRELARALGLLLARMHQHGILWCTPMPRNVLVVASIPQPHLVVCDLPAAVLWPNPVPQAAALLDLFDAVSSPSRRRDWSAAERFRCLCAYTDGDRARARALWRRLATRSRSGHRIRKNLLMALRTYILVRWTASGRCVAK